VLPADPQLLWALEPGLTYKKNIAVMINSYGLRGEEIEVPKPAGVRRIVTTGDSSVFGVGCTLPNVFSSVLERELGDGVEVINAGVPGYSSAQSLRQLEPLWEPLAPDLVVVGNQWSDNRFAGFEDHEMMERLASRRFRFSQRLVGILRHCALFETLYGLGNRRSRQEIGWGMMAEDFSYGPRRVPIDDYVANLDAFVERAQQADAEVLFLMLPNRTDLRAPERFWPWQPYRDAMRAAANRHGCPLVEVPPLFRVSGEPVRKLFLDQVHPSRLGHRLIGQAIADTVRQTGWLDGHPLTQGGTGAPPPGLLDPFVTPWDGAAVPRPSVAGFVRVLAGDTTIQITAYAQDDPSGRTPLDQTVIPGQGPFALTVDPPQRAWLQVKMAQHGKDEPHQWEFPDQVLDLTQGPAWALVVDLDDNSVVIP
jgi:lysophospholipase L1-like esterase